MKVALNQTIEKMDALAVEKYNMPSILLMENAGNALADEILKSYKKSGKIIFFCGGGNNGGDGLVAARHLHNKGYQVIIFIVGKLRNSSSEYISNMEMIKALKIQIESIVEINALRKVEKFILEKDIIVDCIFGTGLSRPIEGIQEQVIEAINQSKSYTMACDIPSGICGNTGQILGCAVDADKTVALCLPKAGNILYPGADYSGEIVVRDISIPIELLDQEQDLYRIITDEKAKQIFPTRKRNTHKGDYGKAILIAGSTGMSGAAILCSRAILRSGVGLLKVFSPESLNLILTINVPEAVTMSLGESRKGVMNINQIGSVLEKAQTSEVVAIGPGCGINSEILELIKRLIQEYDKPLVIDADGLNNIAKHTDVLKQKKGAIIITPHPGEMGRLMGITAAEVNADPIHIAQMFSRKYQVITVLKGSRTIVSDEKGNVHININGNPGMATAGSGDVLTGIITSFIAQGLSPIDACIMGVYTHGKSGDIMADKIGEHGLIARDLVEGIKDALKDI